MRGSPGMEQGGACRSPMLSSVRASHLRERAGRAVLSADTFANFPCEGLDRRIGFCVPISGNEHMSSADKLSILVRVSTNARFAVLAGAALGLVPAASVLAAEPPVSVEYRSAFADYRHFDAEALTVEWQRANDAIRDGAEDASHGMHDMPTPMEVPPTMGDEPPPTTPDEHQGHHQ